MHLVVTRISLNKSSKSGASGEETLSKFTKRVSIESGSVFASRNCRSNAHSIVDALKDSVLSNWQKK